MSAEQTLYAALTAGSPANAVVSIVGDRVYAIVVPEGKAVPSIAYQRVNTEYTNTIHSDAVMARVTFDIFSVAAQFQQAENLANAVAAVLEETPDIVKINRTHTFDFDSQNYAVVLTVDVWE